MLCDVRVLAPAKINIGLRVLPPRSDGFHNIESIFQSVPLYDVLHIEVSDGKGNGCTVSCRDIDLPEKNTLTSAYQAFVCKTGVKSSVKVLLEKRIPHGAGLGGGSSDAAALICALDKIFCTELTVSDLHEIAGSVGSDVFFFVDQQRCGHPFAALVEGRGERVCSIAPRNDLFFVLVSPDVHSSTAEAYRLVDDWYSPQWSWKGPLIEDLENMYRSPLDCWNFLNSFSDPLIQRYPLIQKALEDLVVSGATYVQMSGSGSSVFGVFDSKRKADSAFLTLSDKWKRCYSFPSS